MVVVSKKIIYLNKMYIKIRNYCMLNFILKSGDEGVWVYDSVLNYVKRLINDVSKQDDNIKEKRKERISEFENLSKQGFSCGHIKRVREQREIELNKEKAKKEYMDRIIYEAYYRRKEDDRDFGGELDIWGNSTEEFNFITQLGVSNPYIELQKIGFDKEKYLSVDDTIILVENIVSIFKNQKDKNKLKGDLLDAFGFYGINLWQ